MKQLFQCRARILSHLTYFSYAFRTLDIFIFKLSSYPLTHFCTPDGVTELPFEFRLEPLAGQQLQETYHGIYVNVQYLITADLTGSLLGRNLQEILLFFVECPNAQKLAPAPESFVITPDGIEVTAKKSTKPVPKFKLSGKIDSKTCAITQPFTGHIVIEECEVPIRSIELQLLRVETVGSAEGFSKERTEIQNIQIGDGDVPRNFQIDIHMIFPRLFSCRTVQERTYKVEFDITLVVLFEDGRNITENFPITLVREWGA